MRIDKRKTLAGLGVIAIAALGIQLVGTQAAQAHTPSAAIVCSGWNVNLSNYAASQDAQDATYKTVTDKAAVPAKDAVTHDEWQWTKITTTHYQDKTQKETPGDGWVQGSKAGSSGNYHWSHPDTTETQTQQAKNSPGYGWTKGAKVVVIDSPAVPAQDAVTHQEVDKAAVAAKTNHVTVTLDGTTKDDQDFSTSFSDSGDFDGTSDHHLVVNVTAWDSSQYNFQFDRSTQGCQPPFIPTHVTCVWLAPAGATLAQPFAAGAQTLENCDGTIPSDCGKQYQVDVYSIENQADQDVLDQLKQAGTLDDYADASIYESATWQTNDACATTVDVPAAPQPLPPTCDTAGTFVLPDNSGPYKWTAGPGENDATVHLIFGYQFADGTRGPVTFHEDVLPKLTDGCTVEVTPVNPEVTQAVCDTTTGVDSAPTVTAASTEGITYIVGDDLSTVTAYPNQGNVLANLPDGWTANEDGTATFAVTLNVVPCEKPTTPSTPTTPTTPVPPKSTPPVPPTHTTTHVVPQRRTAPPTNLSSTGFDTASIGGIGALVLLVGGLVLFAGRRKTRREH